MLHAEVHKLVSEPIASYLSNSGQSLKAFLYHSIAWAEFPASSNEAATRKAFLPLSASLKFPYKASKSKEVHLS